MDLFDVLKNHLDNEPWAFDMLLEQEQEHNFFLIFYIIAAKRSIEENSFYLFISETKWVGIHLNVTKSDMIKNPLLFKLLIRNN